MSAPSGTVGELIVTPPSPASSETLSDDLESPIVTHPNPEPPVRILLQSLVHSAPGLASYTLSPEENKNRTSYMFNKICQYHWNCDSSSPEFRCHSFTDGPSGKDGLLAPDRREFFLVDYGTSENEDDVPVLSYELVGESLKPLPGLAQEEDIQIKLMDWYPFPYKKLIIKLKKLVPAEFNNSD
ncbi:hypothetical protein BO78DRAFT_427193 [Aspergillus sclerotiicarbonarius CBS 121057]|uniref:Uncharacterized protein n=1 Tax=Aspergillus sclerotiicarbonarius (strain CBS 121057 / IBT 28362) TaxID=1448318 RepID=A0A319ESA4_ASPSB|nr:hypothetical protein BO78DRAFT_427193 [Aspergillus sclerotiicarbonarius CBS 121057]